MGAFLREHQEIAAPIIEWGGLFLLLFIILSPFLAIRHQYFKPTRWWHVVGAYTASFLIYLFLVFNSTIDQWLIHNMLNSIELSDAHFQANWKILLLFIVIYPLLVFYSARILYGSFNLKRFLVSVLISTALFVMLSVLFIGLMVYGLGQASMNF